MNEAGDTFKVVGQKAPYLLQGDKLILSGPYGIYPVLAELEKIEDPVKRELNINFVEGEFARIKSFLKDGGAFSKKDYIALLSTIDLPSKLVSDLRSKHYISLPDVAYLKEYRHSFSAFHPPKELTRGQSSQTRLIAADTDKELTYKLNSGGSLEFRYKDGKSADSLVTMLRGLVQVDVDHAMSKYSKNERFGMLRIGSESIVRQILVTIAREHDPSLPLFEIHK